MLLSKRFINNVLRVPEMRDRILAVVIDEAHVVSHWGSDFRKKYGTLGVLRALLPKGTPMVAMSATLPGRVRRDVLRKLQFDEDNYTYLNIGNDRPNVSLVVRAIQNPLNTFTDLDFVIPKNALQPEDVEKTFIYADNVTQGSDIMEHLYEISPESFREAGIIRTYNAGFSKEYRPDVLQLFREGKVRILICTDAAGMVSPSHDGIYQHLMQFLHSRDATYLILIQLFNGNYHPHFPHLFKERGGLHEDTGALVLQFFLSKSWHMILILLRQLFRMKRKKQRKKGTYARPPSIPSQKTRHMRSNTAFFVGCTTVVQTPS